MSDTIEQNLQRLVTAKGNIATAITNKGGTVGEDDGFESFADDIATIPAGLADVNYTNVSLTKTSPGSQSPENVFTCDTTPTSQSNNPITSSGVYNTTGNISSILDTVLSGTTLITKSISSNGTYIASDDNADGYSAVSVSVPNSYTQSDEGKVVSNGALVTQGSDTVTENGTVDTTLISSLTVNVPTAGQITSLVKLEPYKNNCVSDIYIGTMITSGIECWFMFGSIELLTTQYGMALVVPSGFDTSKITYVEMVGSSKIYGGTVSSLTWMRASYNSSNNTIGINYGGSGYFVAGNKYSFSCINPC